MEAAVQESFPNTGPVDGAVYRSLSALGPRISVSGLTASNA